MSSFPRQLGRLCTVVLIAHTSVTASLFAYSCVSTDKLFEQHWQYSTPVHVLPRNRYQFWKKSFREPCLNDDARACLLTILKAYGLETSAITSKEVYPSIVVQDSLCRLDGRTEFRDGVYVLEKLFNRVEVTVKEVRQEIQGRQTTFVHAKTDLAVFLRVPWTALTFNVITMPVVITLQLQHAKEFGGKQVVTALENRWFGGSICSYQTGSTKSPWGDVGDLCRRYNGFMLSSLMTKQENLQNRIDLSRMRAQAFKTDPVELEEAQFVRSMSGDN